jgi:hypothetical protein
MKMNSDVAKGAGLAGGVLLAFPALHLLAGGIAGPVHAIVSTMALALLAVCGAALAGKGG